MHSIGRRDYLFSVCPEKTKGILKVKINSPLAEGSENLNQFISTIS